MLPTTTGENSSFSDQTDRYRKVNDILSSILQEYDNLRPPNIVVLGEQSAGKSSVLEYLSGVRFVTGENMVTRCPLQLRMVYSKTEQPVARVKSIHSQVEEIPNPESAEGSKEIERAVKDLTNIHIKKSGKSVSSDMIEVEIVSQTVPDLTLIDLPGLISFSPDNEPNLMEDIRDLVMQNATERDCILVVGDASRDLATIVGLKEARLKDPAQERTLVVLTKVDKYIKDPDALQKMTTSLANKGVIQLKHGFVGLKNRLQDERDKTIEECEEIEKRIMSHLGQVPKGRQILITKLKSIQNAHLKDSLPKQKQILKKELEIVNEKLRQFSKNVEAHRNGKSGLKEIYQKIVDQFYSAVEHFSEGVDICMTTGISEEEEFQMMKTQQQPLSLSTFTTFVESMKRNMVSATTLVLSEDKDYYEWVCQRLDSQKGYPGLPDLYQPAIILHLCRMKYSSIEESIENIVEEMCTMFKEHLIQKILPSCTNSVIENANIMNLLASVLEEHVQGKISDLLQRFNHIFKLEKQRTFTTNNYYTKDCQEMEKFIQRLKSKEKIEVYRWDLYKEDQRFLKTLHDKTDNAPNLGKVEAAVNILIKVRAYLKVACNRISDNMGMEIYDTLFIQTKDSVRTWLKCKEFNNSSEEMDQDEGIDEYKIVEALSPSPEEVIQYENLERKKHAIMDALKVIGHIL